MSSKAVVFAYHDIGCAGIEALLNTGYRNRCCVYPCRRPQENNFDGSVAQPCARNGIPVHAPEDANHPLWIERIAKLNPDYIFSFYYRNLLSEPLLATARKGAFNLHGSLLPKLPWPRAGQLGAGQRRNRNRRDPAPHGQACGCAARSSPSKKSPSSVATPA